MSTPTSHPEPPAGDRPHHCLKENGARRSRLFRDLLIFWCVVFLVILVWKHTFLVTGILIAAYLVRYFIWPDREDHVFYAAGAIIGSVTEIIATRAGIWSYALPSFLNIPLWLPFAWGFAVVLIIRIGQSFVRD